MSKSKDNIESQEALEAKLTNAEKLAQEDVKHKRTAKRYGIAVIVLIIAAIGAVVWNSGIFQLSAPAATVNGEDISVGELSFYYNSMMQEEMYNAYYYGTSTYDYTIDASAQMYDDSRTYHDYFLELALSEIQSVYGLLSAAQADGFTMDQATLDSSWESTVSSLEYYAYSAGLTTAEAYLQYNYGSYVTMDIYEDIYMDQSTATAYVTAKAEDFAPSQEALEAYYAADAANLDTYTIDYMVILATAPTTDDDGEVLTDEETAAGLEDARASAESDANEIIAALDSGEDFETLGAEYGVYGAYAGDQYMGLYLNSSFSEWVMDDSRQAGDTTVTLYEGTDRYVYYVVRYQDSVRDDAPTASIRHIFLSAGYDPTQEEYDAAYSSAEAILEMWETSGDATADSFGDLAYYYSADTSSSSNGGLITGIGTTSGYVDTFTEWCLDEDRYPGETGLVINEASDQKGWHIMYFEGKTGAQWELIAESDILSEDMTLWHDALVATIPAQLESGSKYVG